MILGVALLLIVGTLVSYEAHKKQFARLKLGVDNAKATEVLGLFYGIIGLLISLAGLTLIWQEPQGYKVGGGFLFHALILSCGFGLVAVSSGVLMVFGPKRLKAWILA